MSLLMRTSLRLKDFARFNPICRWLAAGTIEFRDVVSPPRHADECARSVTNLAKAARICPLAARRDVLERKMRLRIRQLDPSHLNWDSIFPHSRPREIRKGVILKKPVSEREKGALFIAFEDHWLRLLRYVDLEKLHRQYHLVLAPTWSPPHDLPLILAARMWPGTLFHIMSAVIDRPVFARLADNLESIPLISSNWVDPEVFEGSEPVAKQFDIVMLANFAVYKRHWLLFSVLRDLPQATKVLLLGRGWEGRTSETIMDEARAFRTADRITMKEGLSDTDMVRAIKSAKVSLIFSGNEGACVAVVETMFADVPVGLFADAIIGSKAYINEYTGRLFTRPGLAAQLQEFVENYSQYHPHRWVVEHGVSYVNSTKILNDGIRDAVLNMGEEWTTDILPHQWRPNPTYVSEDICAKMRPCYDKFESDFGLPLITSGVNDR